MEKICGNCEHFRKHYVFISYHFTEIDKGIICENYYNDYSSGNSFLILVTPQI